MEERCRDASFHRQTRSKSKHFQAYHVKKYASTGHGRKLANTDEILELIEREDRLDSIPCCLTLDVTDDGSYLVVSDEFRITCIARFPVNQIQFPRIDSVARGPVGGIDVLTFHIDKMCHENGDHSTREIHVYKMNISEASQLIRLIKTEQERPENKLLLQLTQPQLAVDGQHKPQTIAGTRAVGRAPKEHHRVVGNRNQNDYLIIEPGRIVNQDVNNLYHANIHPTVLVVHIKGYSEHPPHNRREAILYCRDRRTGSIAVARQVNDPIFPRHTIAFLHANLSDQSQTLLKDLGPAWLITREDTNERPIYIPKFRSDAKINPFLYEPGLFRYKDHRFDLNCENRYQIMQESPAISVKDTKYRFSGKWYKDSRGSKSCVSLLRSASTGLDPIEPGESISTLRIPISVPGTVIGTNNMIEINVLKETLINMKCFVVNQCDPLVKQDYLATSPVELTVRAGDYLKLAGRTGKQVRATDCSGSQGLLPASILQLVSIKSERKPPRVPNRPTINATGTAVNTNPKYATVRALRPVTCNARRSSNK